MAYSIDNALKSGLFDAVIVSTDDFDIANTAADYGAGYVMRDYDDGTKGTQEVAADFLNSKAGQEFGMCCCLYATAPLLTWRDIVEGWKLLHLHRGADYTYTADIGGIDIGGLYWGWAQSFREGAPLEMNSRKLGIPDARAIDINTERDWLDAERMYEALHGN